MGYFNELEVFGVHNISKIKKIVVTIESKLQSWLVGDVVQGCTLDKLKFLLQQLLRSEQPMGILQQLIMLDLSF